MSLFSHLRVRRVIVTFVANLLVLALLASPAGAGEDGFGLVDPAQGIWYLVGPDGDPSAFFYGNPSDIPFVGDWDCDGVETPGLFRQSDAFAYLRNANSQGIADIRFFFGNPDDIPLAGDFNGDGCDTLSLYRPSEQRFYIVNKLGQNNGGLGPADFTFGFGNPGDKPVVGDWDTDGVEEVGLHRESTGLFYFRNTLTTGNADGQFIFGDPNDRFVGGDWNGNGSASPAIFRPSDSKFYFRFTLNAGNANRVRSFGGGSWLPVAGDFGSLGSGVTVTLTGATDALENAVESLYLMKSAAPGLPEGLRSHLASLGTAPASMSLSGAAATGTIAGQEIAVVTIGSDVVLAVKEGLSWRVVGAKLPSLGKSAWYGGTTRSVLIVGTDLGSNADSVHLLSAVPATGKGEIVGIPRDTYVSAPGHLDKIAITFRITFPGHGPDLTLATMRSETGLPIEGYIYTAFTGFNDLVDVFGGFVSNLFYPIPPLPAGPNTLDGPKAELAARERKSLPNGDVDRSLNGGDLMIGALAKVKALGPLALPTLLGYLDTFTTTDLSPEQLLTLGAAAFELSGPGNSVVEGVVENAELIHGVFVFGFRLTSLNRTTFTDLADGVLDPGRCTAIVDPPPNPALACWRRP